VNHARVTTVDTVITHLNVKLRLNVESCTPSLVLGFYRIRNLSSVATNSTEGETALNQSTVDIIDG